MKRTIFFLAFAGFIAYGAWSGCSDSMRDTRIANYERAQLLESI